MLPNPHRLSISSTTISSSPRLRRIVASNREHLKAQRSALRGPSLFELGRSAIQAIPSHRSLRDTDPFRCDSGANAAALSSTSDRHACIGVCAKNTSVEVHKQFAVGLCFIQLLLQLPWCRS